jgi:predicted dienelactone hydrolase
MQIINQKIYLILIDRIKILWLPLLLMGCVSFPVMAKLQNNIAIGVRTLTFFDATRQRPIITEVFYPVKQQVKASLPDSDVWSSQWKREPEARDAPFAQNNHTSPLILFSHGSQGYRLDNVWLAYALVKQGYIVVSVDHYGDTNYLSLAKLEMQIWDRPLDISFALRALLKNSFIQDKIDTKRIGFVGFSKGGLTGILLAGGISNLSNTTSLLEWQKIIPDFTIDEAVINNIDFNQVTKSYQDPLIKAVFLMAPAWGKAFDKTGLQHIHLPIQIVAGEGDKMVPIKDNAHYFAHWIPNNILTILPGKVGHFVFLNEATKIGKKNLPSFIAQDDPSVERHKIHEQVSKQAIQFFSRYLRN